MYEPHEPPETPTADRLPLGWMFWDEHEREIYTQQTGFTDWPDQAPLQDPLEAALDAAVNRFKEPTPHGNAYGAPEIEDAALNGATIENNLMRALRQGQ